MFTVGLDVVSICATAFFPDRFCGKSLNHSWEIASKKAYVLVTKIFSGVDTEKMTSGKTKCQKVSPCRVSFLHFLQQQAEHAHFTNNMALAGFFKITFCII